jgi:hypothetical protein
MHRARHHLAGTQRRARHTGHLGERALERLLGAGRVHEGRGRLGVAPATKRLERGVHGDRAGAASADEQHTPLHRDREQEHVPVGHLSHPRGERRHVLDVLVRLRPGGDHPQPRDLALRAAGGKLPEQVALLGLERAAQVPAEERLIGAEPHARGERLDVPEGRRGVRERAGVLVNAERERGRVHRRDLDAPVEQHLQHAGHDAAVGGHERVAGRGLAGAVVVERDHLDVFPAAQRGEATEPLGARHLDQHEPPDRAMVHGPGLDARDLVRVQVVELAHIAVDAPVQAHARTGIQQLAGQHPREGVEVDVRVRKDQRVDRDCRGHRPRPDSRSVRQPPGTGTARRSGLVLRCRPPRRPYTIIASPTAKGSVAARYTAFRNATASDIVAL